MKIELAFEDVPGEIQNAIANIQVEDQSEADAPALSLSSKRVGPFKIHYYQPQITVDVDLTIPGHDYEPSLFVKVEGYTQSLTKVKFINTTTVVLSGEPNEFVRVSLERIL